MGEFSLVARGEYDKTPHVVMTPHSDRPEKRRAEELALVAAVLTWARGRGIRLEQRGEDVIVRG